MTTQELLKATRKLFTNRENWTQGTYDNANGAYCLVGGLLHEAEIASIDPQDNTRYSTDFQNLPVFRDTIDFLIKAMPEHYPASLTTFNDSSTYEKVMAFLDSVIVPDTPELDYAEEFAEESLGVRL